MNSPNWERLRVMRAVLESGSLSAAARRLGLSQPTVSRQVRALERELGASLVDVTPDGVLPTAAGLRLAPALDEMARCAAEVAAAQSEQAETPVVRITCGPWTAGFFGRHLHALLGSPVDTQIEVVSSIAFADLPRREADIAVRNRRPKNPSLVVRKLPDYSCAVYAAAELARKTDAVFDERRFGEFDWAALDESLGHFPTARWLSKRLRTEPVARFSTSVTLLDAVKGGHVLAVLPCFAADPEHGLVRVSETFVPDYGGHWLALADDVRRRPSVRRIADRIVALLEEHRALLLPPAGHAPAVGTA